MIKHRAAFFTKDGYIGAIFHTQREDVTVMSSYDERNKEKPYQISIVPYGENEARSFESQVELTKEREWQLKWSGIPSEKSHLN